MNPGTTLTTAVSGTIAIVCIVAAVAMWTIGNKHFPRVIILLMLTGATGLIPTPIGNYIRRALTWSYNFTGQLIGKMFGKTTVEVVLAIATCTGLWVLYVLIMHLKRKTLDKHTVFSTAAVPFTAIVIPGPLGAAAVTAVTAVAGLIASGIGAAFGWR